MPVFLLNDKLAFPSPECAENNGLLAVGGDLSLERLLLAYRSGIFPWYPEESPILWWSPDPRLVLIPKELRVSRSLGQAIRKGIFTVTMDTAFEDVINHCAEIRRDKDEGTWLTSAMIDAYIGLHKAGFAHSVESWHDGNLAGGLYGVALGSVFFGESMFSLMANASKVAFVKLVDQLTGWNFSLIDCQVTTGHLMRFGAREIPRKLFLDMVRDALNVPRRKGKWVVYG